MHAKPEQQLEAWLALRDLNIDQVAAMFGLTPEQAIPERRYGQVAGLREFSHPDAHAGAVLFRGDKFMLFYIEDLADELALITPAFLQRYLGGAGVTLRSRAGKRCRQHVYAERGIAYSACDDAINFLEIFPPTTLEEYRNTLYQEPSKFTR